MKSISSLVPLVLLCLACDPSGQTAQPTETSHLVTAPARDLAALRRATDAFHTIPAVEAAGYAVFGGCFQDPTMGGMGIHYANDALIGDSAVDARHPELMVYQPSPSGELNLVAVEYIVFKDEWHAKGHTAKPRLFGHDFHVNETLLAKPFYLLHVWVWKENPSGTFMDWNPRVTCP